MSLKEDVKSYLKITADSLAVGLLPVRKIPDYLKEVTESPHPFIQIEWQAQQTLIGLIQRLRSKRQENRVKEWTFVGVGKNLVVDTFYIPPESDPKEISFQTDVQETADLYSRISQDGRKEEIIVEGHIHPHLYDDKSGIKSILPSDDDIHAYQIFHKINGPLGWHVPYQAIATLSFDGPVVRIYPTEAYEQAPSLEAARLVKGQTIQLGR